MRLMKTVSHVAPMEGEHYGSGWAVAFGDDPERGTKHMIHNYSPIGYLANTLCLVATVGTHEMIVSGPWHGFYQASATS